MTYKINALESKLLRLISSQLRSFIEYKGQKIVYKRYASLHFCFAIDQDDNELIVLAVIHRYVELLDKCVLPRF